MPLSVVREDAGSAGHSVRLVDTSVNKLLILAAENKAIRGDNQLLIREQARLAEKMRGLEQRLANAERRLKIAVSPMFWPGVFAGACTVIVTILWFSIR